MPKMLCPECGEGITLAPEEVLLYSTVVCDECGAVLEIVSEDPPTASVVEPPIEEDTFDEDFDEDDFDDD